MHERPIRTDVSNWYCMKGKKVIWLIIAVAAALIIGLLLVQRARRLRVVAERLSVPIEGAVIQRDADTNKELPIADVVITASDGVRSAATRSDSSGYFKLCCTRGYCPISPSLSPFAILVTNPST